NPEILGGKLLIDQCLEGAAVIGIAGDRDSGGDGFGSLAQGGALLEVPRLDDERRGAGRHAGKDIEAVGKTLLAAGVANPDKALAAEKTDGVHLVDEPARLATD